MMKEYKLYKGKYTINFDDVRHIFYTLEGTIPSVTAITGLLDKSPQLTAWAVKVTGNYLRENIKPERPYSLEEIEELILQAQKEHTKRKLEAADIGTQIHEWIDRWLKEDKPELPQDPKVVNGIQAFLKFQQEYKIKWHESERVVYSEKYHYAGFLDAVGKVGKDLVLFDFKSSNGVYPEMILQTAGYQIAYEEETKKKIKYRVLLKFGKDDGSFEYREFKNNKEDKKAFLNLLQIKNWLKNNK